MKIARTHSNAVQLRRLLAQPSFVGPDAWKLSDDEVFERGERAFTGMQEAFPAIAEAGRRYGEAISESAKALAKLGRAFGNTAAS